VRKSLKAESSTSPPGFERGYGCAGNRGSAAADDGALLNNAAQSLAGAGGAMAGEEQVIRVSVSVSGSRDGERVHLLVSDTGPGFVQPGRVLSLAIQGAGLSGCYGIVHEHGGEISGSTCIPHGGGAVELPVMLPLKNSGGGGRQGV